MLLVDVVLMRRDGVKIPPDLLHCEPAIRGWLVITTRRNGSIYPGQPPTITTATLRPSPSSTVDLVQYLEPAMRKPSLRGGQFVVVGRESYGNPYAHRSHPQAWWVRIVDG